MTRDKKSKLDKSISLQGGKEDRSRGGACEGKKVANRDLGQRAKILTENNRPKLIKLGELCFPVPWPALHTLRVVIS